MLGLATRKGFRPVRRSNERKDDCMIINIRGTGGSGKSTVVRRVIERYNSHYDEFIDGRKQPIGTLHVREVCTRCGATGDWGKPCPNNPAPGGVHSLNINLNFAKKLWSVGHYNTACGGGDTLKSPAQVFEWVNAKADCGYDVIFEGIISQDDVTRTIATHRCSNLLVIGLTTPLPECLAGIQSRRDERGDERELNPKNTEARAKRLQSAYARLKDAGVRVEKASREDAFHMCLKELGL
jgi:hypothetical protein